MLCVSDLSSALGWYVAGPRASLARLLEEVAERSEGLEEVAIEARLANAVEVRSLAIAASDRRLLRELFEKLSDGDAVCPRKESGLKAPLDVSYGSS